MQRIDIRDILGLLNDHNNNSLGSILRAAGIVITDSSQSEGEESDNTPAPPTLPPCPGLTYITDPNMPWTVPQGETSDRATYCAACTRELNIVGEQHYANSKCNCNSYLTRNHIDNGVFNISFWSTDLKTLYADGTMPSGTEFCILVDAKVKRGQYYSYEYDTSNNHISNTVHHNRTTLIEHKGNNKFLYLNPEEPLLPVLQQYSEILPHIVTGTITFNFNIYTAQRQDCLSETHQDYGRFVYNNNTVETNNKTPIMPLLQNYYNRRPKEVLPYTRFSRFSKKPVVMTVSIQREGSDSVNLQRYKDLIKHHQGVKLREAQTLLCDTREQLSTLQSKILELRRLETTIQQSITELQ